MQHVLCFLNRLDFLEKISCDLIEQMGCVKRQLVIEFGGYKISTMIYALDIVDEMIVLIITNELNDLLEENNSLRQKIYYLISFKQFVDTKEHVFEHQFD